MADAVLLSGGPRNGRYVALHVPSEYRVAFSPGVYTPMFDPLGMPYRTDTGHPIYRWRDEHRG